MSVLALIWWKYVVSAAFLIAALASMREAWRPLVRHGDKVRDERRRDWSK